VHDSLLHQTGFIAVDTENECVCHFKGCEVQVQKNKIKEVNWLRQGLKIYTLKKN
jgi:hypothetical protein